jgi:hypothetical protein
MNGKKWTFLVLILGTLFTGSAFANDEGPIDDEGGGTTPQHMDSDFYPEEGEVEAPPPPPQDSGQEGVDKAQDEAQPIEETPVPAEEPEDF